MQHHGTRKNKMEKSRKVISVSDVVVSVVMPLERKNKIKKLMLEKCYYNSVSDFINCAINNYFVFLSLDMSARDVLKLEEKMMCNKKNNICEVCENGRTTKRVRPTTI